MPDQPPSDPPTLRPGAGMLLAAGAAVALAAGAAPVLAALVVGADARPPALSVHRGGGSALPAGHAGTAAIMRRQAGGIRSAAPHRGTARNG